MKKVMIGIGVFLLVGTSVFAVQRYGVKSGIVHYKTSGSGNIMGMTTKTNGESILAFKKYGHVSLQKGKTTQTVMGEKKVEENLVKLDGNTIYAVDEEKKTIFKKTFSSNDKNAAILGGGEKALKQMGGKKIGKDKVLGYKCDIWEISGGTICVYKGIALRSKVSIMGITQEEVATKIKFNIPVSNKTFVLPKYPIKTQDDMMKDLNKQMKDGMKNASPEEKKQMMEMMKQMQKMMQDSQKK